RPGPGSGSRAGRIGAADACPSASAIRGRASTPGHAACASGPRGTGDAGGARAPTAPAGAPGGREHGRGPMVRPFSAGAGTATASGTASGTAIPHSGTTTVTVTRARAHLRRADVGNAGRALFQAGFRG